MTRILVAGDPDKVKNIIAGLIQEKGILINHVVAVDTAYWYEEDEDPDVYDLIILEPDITTGDAKEIAHTARLMASNRVCIIAPQVGMKGYTKGEEFEVDFITEACPRRIMEAYEQYMEGPDDI